MFVVTWFAGLFYIVRLFVYLTEAAERPAEERRVLLPQLQLMARRLWLGITWPSALATLVLGSTLLSYHLPSPPTWLWVKLGLLVGLYAYHLGCHWIHRELQQGRQPLSSRALRIYNEIATLFLFAIVFLAVVKSNLGLLYGLVGLAVLTALLLVAISVYRRIRQSAATD